MKYIREYKMNFPYGTRPQYIWTVIGRYGAQHLHITSYEMDGVINFSGGLESHWRVPPDYMKDEAPSHSDCWLLKQPCWHDGTSSYVSDYIIPAIEHSLRSDVGLTMQDHNYIFNLLEWRLAEKSGEQRDE